MIFTFWATDVGSILSLFFQHLVRFSKHNLQKYFQEKNPEPIIFAPFSKGHHSMEDGGLELRKKYNFSIVQENLKTNTSGLLW